MAIHRHRYRRVAEVSLHGLGMRALGNAKRSTRMPQVVNSEFLGQPGFGDRPIPDLASEVGVAQWLAVRRSEDEGIGAGLDITSKMPGEEITQEGRDHHGAGAVGLGGSELELTSSLR
jgi:hypothetical protein